MLSAAVALLVNPLTITIVDYRGWKGSYLLTNGLVEVVVVPAVGRVMKYSFVGGKNVLFEKTEFSGKVRQTKDDYLGFGGDKVWPAPQSLWNGWPPETAYDGTPAKAELLPNGVKLTFEASAETKCKIEREIRLDPKGTAVTFKNRLINAGSATVERAVWQVTQLADPLEMQLPIERSSTQPLGYYLYEAESLLPRYHWVDDRILKIKRNTLAAHKFGSTASPSVITALWGDVVFTMSGKRQRRLPYPDKNSMLQVYTNANPDAYVELEVTSPLKMLKPGESVEAEVRWELAKRE